MNLEHKLIFGNEDKPKYQMNGKTEGIKIDTEYDVGNCNNYESNIVEVLQDSYADMDCRHNLAHFDCPQCQTYLNDRNDFNRNDFFGTSDGFGVSHKVPDFKGDLHDTYNVDRYDNIYDGHTTLQYKNDFRKKLFDIDDF
jgi:hypothetical protein